MIAKTNKSKRHTVKHISSDCNVNLLTKKCNSTQERNNQKYQCSVKDNKKSFKGKNYY